MDFLFTHKKRLLRKYGKRSTLRIVDLAKKLASIKKGKLLLIDELKGKLRKIDFGDKVEAKQLKRLFDSIDKNSKGENSFIVIGGHSIIPFYSVKNPVDDEDKKILTDAPYSSRDEDFLIPQRTFGRLPDSNEKEADFLIQLIKMTIEYHNESGGLKKSFGYSASIWKEASRAVFRVIGDENKLKISPPLTAKRLKKTWIRKQILYFNLHGTKGTPNWYGQRAPDDEPAFPIYPVAITPNEVPVLKGSCVFSEACYGAWIFKKEKEGSMALKFLSQGSIAFVGSTAIAYGPTEPPSREADLLGKYFLQNVEKGVCFGDALKNAKIDFAKKMVRTQGFLDADDKKTLLEFQLYGDPSLRFPKKGILVRK